MNETATQSDAKKAKQTEEKTESLPRIFSTEQVTKHDGKKGRPFYAVIDGFVVDASEFVDTHPGGFKKLLSTNNAKIGWTGEPFGFSMSRGYNKHLRSTQLTWSAGMKLFEQGDGKEVEVEFSDLGKIVILGKLGE